MNQPGTDSPSSVADHERVFAAPRCGDTLTVPDKVVLPEQDAEEAMDRPWQVIVFNDPVNLMPYVTMVLQRIFGYPRATAERMMLDVHRKGRCVVWSGERERAEHYTRQLQAHQLMASMEQAD